MFHSFFFCGKVLMKAIPIYGYADRFKKINNNRSGSSFINAESANIVELTFHFRSIDFISL